MKYNCKKETKRVNRIHKYTENREEFIEKDQIFMNKTGMKR